MPKKRTTLRTKLPPMPLNELAITKAFDATLTKRAQKRNAAPDRTAMDPQARAIIHRLEDALQIVLLLVARLERDLQKLAGHATEIREPLSKVVEAVRELQYVEHTRSHSESAHGSAADTAELAMQWAEEERKAIEHG